MLVHNLSYLYRSYIYTYIHLIFRTGVISFIIAIAFIVFIAPIICALICCGCCTICCCCRKSETTGSRQKGRPLATSHQSYQATSNYPTQQTVYYPPQQTAPSYPLSNHGSGMPQPDFHQTAPPPYDESLQKTPSAPPY